CFDEPDQYAQYAASITSFERQSGRNNSEIRFWAPRHDRATQLTADFLVRPLAEPQTDSNLKLFQPSLATNSRCFLGDEATKKCLTEILARKRGPEVLFTASHGVGWPLGHVNQREKQGALVCQDWN